MEDMIKPLAAAAVALLAIRSRPAPIISFCHDVKVISVMISLSDHCHCPEPRSYVTRACGLACEKLEHPLKSDPMHGKA